MSDAHSSSQRNRELAAQAWADGFKLIDLQLRPLGMNAINALDPKPGEVIVDIGCGTGQTVETLSASVGPEGQVVGVDIAPVLINLARHRTAHLPQARYVLCDAVNLDLPAGSADAMFSRFGVMAFDNPIAAFSRFHAILKPQGRLAFVSWRALEENELDLLPLRATGLEEGVDRTPFSFEDPIVVQKLLTTAGFGNIEIKSHDTLVSSGNLEAMTKVLLSVGPLGKIIREEPRLKATAEPRLRAALRAKDVGGRVALVAATWIVTAQA